MPESENNQFSEFHCKRLAIAKDKKRSNYISQEYKFYNDFNLPPKGLSHIDNSYGVDIDDIHIISDILDTDFKDNYSFYI